MTSEQAIERLEQLKLFAAPDYISEALDIAIKALELQIALVEALEAENKMMRDAYNNVSDGDEEYELIEEARAALDKAKGVQS